MIQPPPSTAGADQIESCLKEIIDIRLSLSKLEGLVRQRITGIKHSALLPPLSSFNDCQIKRVEIIKQSVCEAFEIPVIYMTAHTRNQEHISWPRQIAMSLTREFTATSFSLSMIGACFGGRDHGTVMHAMATVKNREETDARIKQALKNLRAVIQFEIEKAEPKPKQINGTCPPAIAVA